MNIYILRHASAGMRRANPILDRKRPLDKEGKRNCLQLAQVLNAMNLQFDLIVSSPLKRCHADRIAGGHRDRLRGEGPLLRRARAGGHLRPVQKLLRECADRENLLLVGHNPNLTLFLGSLIAPAANGVDGPVASVRLRKGSLARVSLTRGPATLQWMLDPRTVRALYATSTAKSRRKTSRK